MVPFLGRTRTPFVLKATYSSATRLAPRRSVEARASQTDEMKERESCGHL